MSKRSSDGANREVARVDAGGHLFPGERRRDAGVVGGARRVGGRQRLAQDVLEVVDVDGAAPALLDHPFDRGDLRMLRRDDRGDHVAEQLPGLVSRPLREREVDVQPARSGRFRHAGDAQPIELVLDVARDVQHVVEAGAVTGIEIDRRVVLRQRIGHARKPRVLRDRRDLRHVQERRQRSADQPIARALFADRLDLVRQDFAPDARRRRIRMALLIERRLVDAVRKPLHDHRPIGDGRQQQRRHLHVVAEQLAFGDAQLRARRSSRDWSRAECRHPAARDRRLSSCARARVN